MLTLRKVGSASIPHYNQISSPSEEAALVSKDGYKKVSSLTLYIPMNIDIDRILEENPPDFNYERDCFVYIIHLIHYIPSRKRDSIDENNGFTHVNRKKLQGRVHEYKRYIEYLKRVGIVDEDRHYIPSKKSMGLKITERYNSAIIPVSITKWTLIKNILYLNNQFNVKLTEDLEYLKLWFNDKIEVDFLGGLSDLRTIQELELDNPEIKHEALKFNSRLLPFLKLYRKDYNFHVDNTGFRLHTNITQTKSELRKYIKYDGKTLCAIDIVNSQPFLSIALLDNEVFLYNNLLDKITNPIHISNPDFPIMVVEKIKSIKNKSDVILFKELVSSGQFYENFAKLLVENEIIENDTESNLRETAKDITFCTIYSPNTFVGFKESVKLFKQQFPNVFEIFKIIKKGHGNHPAFAICLQRLEAELVLHKICKEISIDRPDIFIATLHDSIITTEDHVSYVRSVMYRVLKKNIGIAPKFKVERWE